jgi:outer membrane beta-barrel protein
VTDIAKTTSKDSPTRRRATAALFAVSAAFAAVPARAEIGSFDAYEIRVIRPKYMAKRNRVELGGQGTLIMNQSFIYTLMLSGMLDYHFSEMFALEVGGSYGFSIDKEDKTILEKEFDIKTQILRTQYMFNGGLLWTPIYGKTQLPSGRLVYFDSFLTFQGGLTGIQYTYEQCIPPPGDTAGAADPDAPTKPPETTKSYPTGIIGFGQKYFLSTETGLRWDVRTNLFPYERADGSCNPEEPVGSELGNNITLQFGASTFF